MLFDEWQASKHPRGKGGKFAKKGSATQSSCESKQSKPSNPKYAEIASKSKEKNNTDKVYGQYSQGQPMNEWQFYGSDNTNKRQKAIRDVIGCGIFDAYKIQKAICGQLPYDYDSRGIIDEPGWCWHGDKAIRQLSNPRAVKQAQVMHDYVKRAPKYEGTIYRGVCLPNSVIEQFKQGAMFEQNGAFSSWSQDENIAHDFAQQSWQKNFDNNEGRVVFQMDDPSYGVPFGHLSLFPQQKQVLVSNIEQNRYRIGKVEDVKSLYGRKLYTRVCLQEVK